MGLLPETVQRNSATVVKQQFFWVVFFSW